MIGSIISLLGAGLSLWSDKEKNRYIDKMIDLRTRYYAESNKPDGERDDAILDSIEFDIKTLCNAFVSVVNRDK